MTWKNFLRTLVLTVMTFCFYSVSSVRAENKELYMYIWSEYIPDSVLKRFTDETGIKVHASTFDNLDDMYAKIKITKGKGYDLVMASLEYMGALKRQNLLHELDKSRLSNLKHIHPDFLDLSFDPQNKYTVPFTVGTSTFAVASDRVDVSRLKKFADLGRPEFKKRLILLNDMRAVLGMGLRMNGYTVNDRQEAHLQQAYQTLRETILPNVKAYDTESTIQALINGEADIVMTWNGLVYNASKEYPAVKEVRFEEGVNYWVDSFAILSASSHVNEAHLFLNFIMRPDISAEISKEFAYTSPNMSARKLLPDEIKNNPTLYPSSKIYKDRMFENDVGDALKLYEKYWLKLKAFHYE